MGPVSAQAAWAGLRVRRLRYALVTELVVAAVVLGLTATLLATTPARTAQAGEATGTGVSLSLTSPLYTVQVQVDPARTGANEVHLYVSGPGGEPVSVREWHATAALPAKGIEPVDIPLLAPADTHAFGEVTFPVAGRWELSVTLRTSEIDEATVRGTVPVG